MKKPWHKSSRTTSAATQKFKTERNQKQKPVSEPDVCFGFLVNNWLRELLRKKEEEKR